jgi:hypothetical protein
MGINLEEGSGTFVIPPLFLRPLLGAVEDIFLV